MNSTSTKKKKSVKQKIIDFLLILLTIFVLLKWVLPWMWKQLSNPYQDGLKSQQRYFQLVVVPTYSEPVKKQLECLGRADANRSYDQWFYMTIANKFLYEMGELPEQPWYLKMWENERNATNQLNDLETYEEYEIVNNLVLQMSGKTIEEVLMEKGVDDSWFNNNVIYTPDNTVPIVGNNKFSGMNSLAQKKEVWEYNSNKVIKDCGDYFGNTTLPINIVENLNGTN